MIKRPKCSALALPLLLAALAGCGPTDGEEAGNAAAPVQTQAPSAPAAPAAPAATPAATLEGTGLRLAAAGSRPESSLAFGTPEAAAVEALTRAFGKPPSERGANEECGGGGLAFAQWDGQFFAWFGEGEFAGWEDRGRLKTAAGLGIGSSRAELAAIKDLSVEESSLGTEFQAGGLGGLLESKAPDAKVSALWAGTTCMFR